MSDSESAVICAFPSCFDESVGLVGDSIGSIDDFAVHFHGVGSGIFSRQELIQLVTLFRWLCLYQKESSPKSVDS